MANEKWASVFDAHPDVQEIFVGTPKDGTAQVFLERRHAGNYAGAGGNVERVTRPVDKKAAEAKAKAEAEAAAQAEKEAAEAKAKAEAEAAKKGK